MRGRRTGILCQVADSSRQVRERWWFPTWCDELLQNTGDVNLDLGRVTDLLRSERCTAVLNHIRHLRQARAPLCVRTRSADIATQNDSSGQDDSGTKEEFVLIAKANELAAEASEHEGRAAKFIKAIYAQKFPELEVRLSRLVGGCG